MEELFTVIWLFGVLSCATWWGLKEPGVAFGLAMSLYVLSQWAVSGSATLLTMSGSVKLLIAGVVFALSVFHISRRKSALRSFSDPQYLILIALYGYSLLSVLWSFERDVSLGVFLANIPYIVVLVLVAPMLVRKKEDLNAFCFSFLFFQGVR